MLDNAMGNRGEAGPPPPPHPRTIGWIGTTALAMGGSNQSLFLIGALLLSQGSAAVPLLIVGLLLSWAAAFGWTELILMWPNRVGGIAATCAEAFRPISPVLANLTGVCYWWGWVPTCGLTAILSASAIKQWYLPWVPVPALATALVILFAAINLCGVRWIVPRAVFASGAIMATVYFVLLPVVWLGVLGPQALAGDLAQVLGPTFAPLVGSGARACAIWFMTFNMFHGTMAPLAGVARTLSQ